MVKAVIFDCFGVLTTEGWLPFKKARFGHDAALNRQAGDLNKQADAGLINHEEFIQAIAKLADTSTREVHRAIDVNVANQELFGYIAERLKPIYKIGLLSNAASNWLEELFTPEQLKLFDAISLSYEEGFIKPHQKAYEPIAGRLHLTPEECVLVDDQKLHCMGAREAGMKAILYTDFEQMKTELEGLLAADTES